MQTFFFQHFKNLAIYNKQFEWIEWIVCFSLQYKLKQLCAIKWQDEKERSKSN